MVFELLNLGPAHKGTARGALAQSRTEKFSDTILDVLKFETSLNYS